MENADTTDRLMKRAIDAKASGNPSEAHALYTQAIDLKPELAEAWMGKGSCAGWMSDLAHDRFDEMKSAHRKGLGLLSSDLDRKPHSLELGLEQFHVAEAFFDVSLQRVIELGSLGPAQLEHANRICKIIDLCENAKELNPGIPYAEFISEVAKSGLNTDVPDVQLKAYLQGKVERYANEKSRSLGASDDDAEKEGRGWISFIGFVVVVLVGIGVGRCVGP